MNYSRDNTIILFINGTFSGVERRAITVRWCIVAIGLPHDARLFIMLLKLMERSTRERARATSQDDERQFARRRLSSRANRI